MGVKSTFQNNSRDLELSGSPLQVRKSKRYLLSIAYPDPVFQNCNDPSPHSSIPSTLYFLSRALLIYYVIYLFVIIICYPLCFLLDFNMVRKANIFLSVKGQTVNILGIIGHILSVLHILLFLF